MKKILILLTIVTLSLHVSAQWECPSRLGATLKPIGSSDLMWSAEITGSAGWIKDKSAANTMAIVGLNYGKDKNSLYVEGGLKAWGQDSRSSVMAGLREAFYRYSGEKNTLTLGLQSARSDDPYLFNERVMGANYTYRSNNIKLNVAGGSVMEAFARNGRFCTYGFLYNDVVVGRPRSFVGNDFGDTNMGLVTLAYTPTKSTDDFGDANPAFLSLDKIGVAAYTEYGRKVTNTLTMGGLYSEIALGGITLKPEILYQSTKSNNAVIYNLTAEKTFHWSDKQTTRFYGQYVGYTPIDESARPVNTFSNLFMGDALHQDVLEAPLVLLGIKHSFTSIKTSIKLQGVMQTKASAMGGDYGFVTDDYTSPLTKMKELELSVSKNFGKHLLVNALLGALEFPSLEHTYNVLHYNHIQTMYGRMEFRFTF